MAKGGGRSWRGFGWVERGRDGGGREVGGGTMAHEGKVSQYYVFPPFLLADKGK